jgi:uncharacterized protein
MDFLVFSRAAPHAADVDDDALNETHWSYMDRFAGSMIARGPTLGPDRETWTGSVHVLGLPDPEAARRFVADEPYNRAGLYADHSIWVFETHLGLTPPRTDEPRFLVFAPVGAGEPPRDRLLLYGTLRDVPDGPPVGVALALQAPARAVVESLVAPLEPREVHHWAFGGRR